MGNLGQIPISTCSCPETGQPTVNESESDLKSLVILVIVNLVLSFFKMGYCKMCRKCRDKANKYFEKNIDSFNKHILCGCGCTYYKRHYKRHLDTEHHKEWEDPEYKSAYKKNECILRYLQREIKLFL